jgi:lipopolysaccharide/colanic/teichoic acid biosynthesis glycosyltransferase
MPIGNARGSGISPMRYAPAHFRAITAQGGHLDRSPQIGLAWRPVSLDEAVIRTLDITIAICLIIFALPLLIAIAMAIKIQDRGMVVLAHERVGKNGQMFKCLKFRSMVLNAEERLADVLQTDPLACEEWERDHKLRRDPRITRVGDFLRRFSLDELPQLINVLRGEMSIVGPRPIVLAEITRYGPRFGNYCAVKPGITGLWQVSGRNNVPYRRRVAMDTIYARNKSFAWDIKLLFLTVPAVLFASGSY